MIHQDYLATQRGLNRNLPARILYEKAKYSDFFNRFQVEVTGQAENLQYHHRPQPKLKHLLLTT